MTPPGDADNLATINPSSKFRLSMPASSAISVVIPCYNAEEYLAEAIRSAVSQTKTPSEIIVVDDGSTDSSARIAEQCGPLVRVIRQDNRGASAARNAGVRAAAGDWIAFLDADDVWAPTCLEKLSGAAETAPGRVWAFNDLFVIHPDGQVQSRPTPVEVFGSDFHVNLLCQWIVNMSGLLVRSDVARTIMFPEGVRYSEDRQYVVLLNHIGPPAHVAEALTGYRRRDGQVSGEAQLLFTSARINLQFAKEHPEIYSPRDVDQVRLIHASWIREAHDAAYWNREHELVRKLRRLYIGIHPSAASAHLPESFSLPLRWRWLLKTKDHVEDWYRQMRNRR